MTKREVKLTLPRRASAPRLAALPAASSDPTLADAVRLAIASAVGRLVENDPLARRGEPEGVHQVRVALRRLRSDLRTLDDAVDPGWRRGIIPRLRTIAAALGDARDLDVLTERLQRDVAADPKGNPDALAPLFDRLSRLRGAAHTALRDALDSPEYAALLDELVAATQLPPTGQAGDQPLETALPRLSTAAWRRLDRRASALGPESPDADFHRVRIAAKRARYAAELAARLLDGRRARRAERFGRKITAVQDQLGALQDAAMAEDQLRATLDDPMSGGLYAFEAGRVAERQREYARKARRGFLRAWPALRKSKWRSWAS